MDDPPHVLIVDDEVTARITLEALLYPEGYQLTFAASAYEALDELERWPADVILLDVMMPEIDGFELCRLLKMNNCWRHIPIVLVTALDSKKDMICGLEAGAEEFLSKPVNALELRARVRSMLRIKKQYDELATLLQQREDLAHMIVHDMRSPLTSILGFSELLLTQGTLGPSERSDAQKILEQARRLQAFTHDLLVQAKMEQGRFILNRVPVNVNRLVEQAKEAHQVTAQLKRIRLVTSFPAPEPPPVLLDAALFERVLDNLLGNALKFSPANSTVTIRVEYPGDLPAPGSFQVRLKVIDEGPGIRVEDQKRIFDKFEIIDLKRSGLPQVGLGLAFCKLVVDAHAGRIFVASNQPGGSIFTVEI